jgi:hypothetical protein
VRLTAKDLSSLFDDPDWKTKFPPLINVDQAAELAAVKKNTIYDWSSQKLLDDCKTKNRRPLLFHRDRFVQILFLRGIINDN